MTPKQIYLRSRRLGQIKIQETYLADVQDHTERKGELPRKALAELAVLKRQIQSAREAQQLAKATLEATIAELQALRVQLQADLAAATTAPQRQAIRAQADAAKLEYDAAVKELEFANQRLASLVQAAKDALLEERYTRNELTADDLPIIAQRKQALANDIAEKWAALVAKKLLDDPRAEERLRNRARVKAALERQANG